MSGKDLFREIGNIDPDLVEEAAEPAKRQRPRLTLVKWVAMAACLALVLVAVARLNPGPQVYDTPMDTTMDIADGAVDDYEEFAEYENDFDMDMGRELEDPATGGMDPSAYTMGVRKFLNYGGHRYAFVEDGAPFDLAGVAGADSLGTLEHDITAGMDGGEDNPYAQMDLATTFALGGTLHPLPDYDPAFRVAVESEGVYYIAELVANVDDSPLDTNYYFTSANLEDKLERIDILAHVEDTVLHTVGGDQAPGMLTGLYGAAPADLTGDEYEAIAWAQLEGRSYRLALRLDDGSTVTMYAIPDQSLVSIGDGWYTLPGDYLARYGDIFAALAQTNPIPLA